MGKKKSSISFKANQTIKFDREKWLDSFSLDEKKLKRHQYAFLALLDDLRKNEGRNLHEGMETEHDIVRYFDRVVMTCERRYNPREREVMFNFFYDHLKDNE